MRKALLEDENVGKIAEDPKKLAFLRAIEDREDDDDDDFLEQPEEPSQAVLESQEDMDSPAQPPVPETTTLKRKRPLQESFPDSGNRAPPAARRVEKMKKPSTLAEIRESVSFLIEEPAAAFHAPHPSDSSDLDVEDGPTSPRAPFVKRRTTNPNPVIDRLSLKRASSSSLSAATTSGTRPAFFTADFLPQPGFKVPSLLRRATTQVTSVNGADSNGISTMAGTERAAGGGEKGVFVRRGGSKKSSVNWYAREMERSKKVREGERRREEGVRRVGEMRRGVLGGVLGGGGFE
jgi:mediator of replication checkpoint protein 1